MTSVLRLVLPLQHLPTLPQVSHFPKLMAAATFSAIAGMPCLLCSRSPAWGMGLLLPGPQKGKLITKEFAMAQGHTTD